MPRLLPHHTPSALRRHIRRGGLIAYPTESCYGLGCLPTHTKALKKLIRLKRRPQHKGMIVIGDKLDRLLPLLQPLGETDRRLLESQWPARKTFLLPAADRIPALLRGRSRRKLAVRVPDHPGARNLCRLLGQPLVSTSCNKAGKRPCRNQREARRQFGRHVLIIGGRCGGAKKPSLIIDWENGRQLR